MRDDFEFISGDASLDLVNTLMHRTQPGGADELLHSAQDAVDWFIRAGQVNAAEAAHLDPEAALHSARRLRTALDAVYRPLALGRPDPDGTARGLRTLNAVLDQGRERVQVSQDGPGFRRGVQHEVLGPLDPGVRVARAAAELLHRLRPGRLRECENPECDLLFYDDSRNGKRRWCSMKGCGNQHKQARFRSGAAAKRPGTGRTP